MLERPLLKVEDQTLAIGSLSLRADRRLVEASLQIGSPLPGAAGTGQPLHVSVGSWRAPLQVVEHHSLAGGATWLRLADPASVAEPFDLAAWGADDGRATLRQVLEAADLQVEGSAALDATYPAITVDRISVHEAVHEVLARETGLVPRWIDRGVRFERLADEAIELNAGRLYPTTAGCEISGVDRLADLGTPIVHDGQPRGRLLNIALEYNQHHWRTASVVAGTWVPERRSRRRGTDLLPGRVTRCKPLVVEVFFDDGQTVTARAVRHWLHADDGACREDIPLSVGDGLLVAWPEGLVCGLLVVLPLGPSAPAEIFTLAARSAAIEADQLQFTAQQKLKMTSPNMELTSDDINIHQ